MYSRMDKREKVFLFLVVIFFISTLIAIGIALLFPITAGFSAGIVVVNSLFMYVMLFDWINKNNK